MDWKSRDFNQRNGGDGIHFMLLCWDPKCRSHWLSFWSRHWNQDCEVNENHLGTLNLESLIRLCQLFPMDFWLVWQWFSTENIGNQVICRLMDEHTVWVLSRSLLSMGTFAWITDMIRDKNNAETYFTTKETEIQIFQKLNVSIFIRFFFKWFS